MSKYKIIISGGGTGGHIFPAVSIANAIKKRYPDSEILFVGAEGRMEMERVPAAGYPIIGLPICGFDRQNLLKNFSVCLKIQKSIRQAKKIIKDFQPDMVIGVGGYASGPVLWKASSMGIPTLIQEQNSYAGVTNKLLSKRASKICVAYDNMERFFPQDRLILTGNPIREDLKLKPEQREEAFEFFGLSPQKKTLLIIGGSLGARTINESILEGLPLFTRNDIQVIWQTGKLYYKDMKEKANLSEDSSIRIYDFISRMDYAYAAADLVVSRAGASSISELCMLGKPAILVPSPNVAEDHQTKNALAIETKLAAAMIPDSQAKARLANEAISIINDEELINTFKKNILNLAQLGSADRIVDEITAIIDRKRKDKKN